MFKQTVCRTGVGLLLVIGLATGLYAAGLDKLSRQVARLDLERNGYVLGAALNSAQIETARAHPVDAAVPGTFKFKDRNLFVVAQKSTNRVLVIYEQFEQASLKQIQDLVGDLYINFEDPTVSAHEKVIYWAYSKKGKISATMFSEAKKKNKKLQILATVKCISDVNIMKDAQEPVRGMIYYVISSDPMLEFFNPAQQTGSSGTDPS